MRNPHRLKHGVLLIDDHAVVREGISSLLDREPDLCVCGATGDPESGRALVRQTRPSLVLVDISLGSDSGLELVRTLRNDEPALPVLVLSMHDELLFAERALKSGARGYIMKHEAAERLLLAIRQVIAGKLYVSDAVTARLLQSVAGGVTPAEGSSTIERLSDRELEVFRLIGSGQTTRDVAERMRISVKTVEAHRARMKIKLGLQTAQELVVRAAHWVLESAGRRR